MEVTISGYNGKETKILIDEFTKTDRPKNIVNERFLSIYSR